MSNILKVFPLIRIERMRFAFLLFDDSGSGYIGKEDLGRIIRANLACTGAGKEASWAVTTDNLSQLL